jgi:hypothetical protein
VTAATTAAIDGMLRHPPSVTGWASNFLFMFVYKQMEIDSFTD